MTENTNQEVVKGVGDVITAEDFFKEMVKVSEQQGSTITSADAKKAFNLFRDTVAECISKGIKVQLTGFLTITPVFKPVRKVFNIATRTPMETKEGALITAKPGKRLKKLAASYDETTVIKLKDEYLSKKKNKES